MQYQYPGSERSSGISRYSRRLFVFGGLSLAAAGVWTFRNRKSSRAGKDPVIFSGEEESPFVPAEPLKGLQLTYPTPRTNLDKTDDPSVFMPTGSGRVESALYGSTRTRAVRNSIRPVFHGGVDIAPTERDSRGRAADPVFSVADGRIAYINPVGGNSSYGIYIVLLHQDGFGEYYTLYAHLARVKTGLKAGVSVKRGDTIGVMGNTSTVSIPVQRSHLHFEFGTVLNSRFGEWYREQELKPWHGTFHGYNLANLNPMDLFPYMKQNRRFSMQDYMRVCPAAFRAVVQTSGVPDYYQRYMPLWAGDRFFSGSMMMDVSESGTPLRGSPAANPPHNFLDGKKGLYVTDVSETTLGRNGARLVVRRNGLWEPGRNAQRWMDILFYGT